MLIREGALLAVLLATMVVCTLTMTDRTEDDWRYAGTVVLIYVVFVGLRWLIWDRRRPKQRQS